MGELGRGLPMGFTNADLPESCHICLIYESDAERRRVVSEYLAAGIQSGDLVRYFTDETDPEKIRGWLTDMGVELPKAEEQGFFGIVNTQSAYCPDGKFEPQTVIDRALQRHREAVKAGYRASRVTGEMSWVRRGIPGSERWLEYEALLNEMNSPFRYAGMCQYDARLFDGATLFKVLQIHPYIIAQGQVVRNPYYLKAEEFLAESTS